jgi:hypothetical protein
MIWLDGLDLPNFVHFPVHFVEHFAEPRYPAKTIDTSDSPIVFPLVKMRTRLDSEPDDYVSMPYLKANGSEGKEPPTTSALANSVYRIYWHIVPPMWPLRPKCPLWVLYSKGIYYVDALCAIQILLGRVGDSPLWGGGGGTLCHFIRYFHFQAR